jgi:hypothetical protein
METTFMEERLCSGDGNNLSISDHDLSEEDLGTGGPARLKGSSGDPNLWCRRSGPGARPGANRRKCLSWVAILSRNCKMSGLVKF